MLDHGQLIEPPPLWWTPWPGIGPGQEVLGDLTGRHVVELGGARGHNAAACAARGADAVGVDVAPEKIQDARSRWRHQSGLRFVVAEAGDYLEDHTEPIDIACSIFGALSFSPAARLLDLIAARLRPGGVVALSARLPPPSPHLPLTGDGAWVPYARSPRGWATVLVRHGFTIKLAMVLPHPERPGAPGCLILAATTACAAAAGAGSSPKTQAAAWPPLGSSASPLSSVTSGVKVEPGGAAWAAARRRSARRAGTSTTTG